jgi:hypothetical protein
VTGAGKQSLCGLADLAVAGDRDHEPVEVVARCVYPCPPGHHVRRSCPSEPWYPSGTDLRHTWVMRSEPLDDTDPIGPLADEVEAGHGPVALVRPGHKPVVLVSAEHWAHLLELESEEETAWWKRDASERAKHV